MAGYRHILFGHRTLAMATILLTLLARMMIPTGYMPMVEHGRWVMTLCPAQGPAPMAHGDMAGMRHASATAMHHGHHDGGEHAKDGLCAFAGVALAATATVDPALLALAILYIVTLVARKAQAAPVARSRFRWPPRTGPPLFA